MFDYETGRSRGFGFVTFQDHSVAHHLLSVSRIQMRDKLVEIKAAEPKEGRRMHGRGRRHRHVDEANAAAAVVPPEAVMTPEEAMHPYAQTTAYPAAYPTMPFYGGYAPAAVYTAAPVYAPVHYPVPALVPNYVAPVYYPPPTEATTAVPDPVMPEQQGGAPGFAGYAYIPFAPPAGSPEPK